MKNKQKISQGREKRTRNNPQREHVTRKGTKKPDRRDCDRGNKEKIMIMMMMMIMMMIDDD